MHNLYYVCKVDEYNLFNYIVIVLITCVMSFQSNLTFIKVWSPISSFILNTFNIHLINKMLIKCIFYGITLIVDTLYI